MPPLKSLLLVQRHSLKNVAFNTNSQLLCEKILSKKISSTFERVKSGTNNINCSLLALNDINGDVNTGGAKCPDIENSTKIQNTSTFITNRINYNNNLKRLFSSESGTTNPSDQRKIVTTLDS